MSEFKPLLAKEADFSLITDWRLPCGSTRWVVSRKLDGIRAIVRGGVVLSRKMLPIPNQHVQRLFGRLEHFDGELICGHPAAKDVYQKTYSAVMKSAGEPEVTFHAFDHIEVPSDDYCLRLKRLSLDPHWDHSVAVVSQVGVHSEAEFRDMEEAFLEEGYEGAMLRLLSGPKSQYKFGRSTPKEGTLLKVKRFTDDEAEIIGFEEEMANNNEATKDELGNTKRSSHAENKVGKGRLGALICKTTAGVVFNIGTGFTAAQREEFWRERANLLGTFAKYKSFLIGVKDAPRFPVFLHFRSPIDL